VAQGHRINAFAASQLPGAVDSLWDDLPMDQHNPLGAANGGSESARRRRSVGIGVWLAAIFFLGFGLYTLADSARNFYGYQVGAPTTATNVGCYSGKGGYGNSCHGTWTVGGQSYSGPINGRVPKEPHGGFGSLDVRADGGTAFTADSVGPYFYWQIIVGLFLTGLGVSIAVWIVRRR
jgi:hypothetical protein